MKVKQVRTGKVISLHAPQFFFAQDRALAEEAHAGDVVGIPNHGTLRIGDTLTEGEDLNFVGVPSFAPEILRRVRLPDAMKAKKLKQALQEMAEEGVVQVFRPTDGSPALVGVVGPLQLDVLRARLADEYGLEVDWDMSEFQLARWIGARNARALDRFVGDVSLGHRRGSRRRSRLPGPQRLQSRLHRAAESRHRLHRREGHPEPEATVKLRRRQVLHPFRAHKANTGLPCAAAKNERKVPHGVTLLSPTRRTLRHAQSILFPALALAFLCAPALAQTPQNQQPQPALSDDQAKPQQNSADEAGVRARLEDAKSPGDANTQGEASKKLEDAALEAKQGSEGTSGAGKSQ